jgi:broad specificity phosphatase PhoE
MIKTTYYFIRHGKVFNPENIIYGRLPNFKLSPQGIADIKCVARLFDNKKIDTIFSSPMLRAKQTALILKGTRRIKIHVSKLLNEIKLFCEGVSADHFKKRIQENLYTSQNISKGQESIGSVQKRMMRFVKKTQHLYKGKHIIVVSHGDPIMILKAFTLHIPFTWEYKKNNYPKEGEVLHLDCVENRFIWKS